MIRCASVLFFLGFVHSAAGAPLPLLSSPKEPEALLELRKAQLAASEQVLKALRPPIDDTIRDIEADIRYWSRRVLDARLALAGTQEDRVLTCRWYAENMIAREQLSKLEYETRGGTIAYYKAASYHRIEAEILLRNAKAPLQEPAKPIVLEKPLELRKAQLTAAEEVHKFKLAEYQAGKFVLDSTLEWTRRVFDARHALATTQAERVRACKWYVDTMLSIEKIAKSKFDAGRSPIADYKATTYFRIEAEILLFKAEAK